MLNHTLEGGTRLKAAGKKMREGEVLVSVITVVYNGVNHIEHTIQSVLKQTYNNIEYIVVDGGSTDGTLDILRKYSDRIAYWKSEPDKGISDAFNKGVALATGELIGILNADDWYEPDAASQIVAHYKPDSILHGNLQYWNEDGSKGMVAYPNLKILPLEMSLNHPTIFVSKSLYSRHGAFSLNYKLSMDYELLLRFYKAGATFIYVNQVITNMRLGGASGDIVACYREVMKAKDEVLGKSVSHKLFYYLTIVRYNTSQALAKTPLSFINKIYRAYFSPTKKHY